MTHPRSTPHHTADDANAGPNPSGRNSSILPYASLAAETMRTAGASEAQIEVALWLLNEASRRGLTNYAAIGQLVNRSSTTISRMYRGEYKADLATLIAHIAATRDAIEQQEAVCEIPFLTGLSVVKSITDLCDLARVVRQMALIWGKNQTGKTEALKHYAGSHPDTIYLRVPAGAGVNKTMIALARACSISVNQSPDDLHDRIMKRFSRTSLLLVDEFHQCVNGVIRKVTVERIREIHDLCGCGVVLCGTDVVPRMMENAKYADFLGQTGNRGRLRLNIPTEPTPADLKLLYRAHGLSEPTGDAATLVRRLATKNGIGALNDEISISRRLVPKGETFTWQHVLSAEDILKASAEGNR